MDSISAWKAFKNGQTPSSVNLDPIFFEKVEAGSQVIDFGCAWGRVPFELQEKGYHVTGFDTNSKEIQRAQAFSEESNQKFSAKVRFDIANAIDLPYKENEFDACIMQAFMTTLTIPQQRRQVLEEAQRVLKENGLLYLGVFAQTWENPKYKRRYEEHYPTTQERGTFIVTEDGSVATQELYRVHHYTRGELEDLLTPLFKIETFKETTFKSYHGNIANGFIVTARK